MIAYLERRKERLIQAMGKEEFKRTVDSVMEILKRYNLDSLPTVRQDLFEYVEGIINL